MRGLTWPGAARCQQSVLPFRSLCHTFVRRVNTSSPLTLSCCLPLFLTLLSLSVSLFTLSHSLFAQAEVDGELADLDAALAAHVPDKEARLLLLCGGYGAYDLAWQMEELLAETPDLDKLANCVALLRVRVAGAARAGVHAPAACGPALRACVAARVVRPCPAACTPAHVVVVVPCAVARMCSRAAP